VLVARELQRRKGKLADAANSMAKAWQIVRDHAYTAGCAGKVAR
jgi:hypothetical protein